MQTMTLNDIMDMWHEDVKIDHSELGKENERTFLLHAKYLDLLSAEKLILRSLQYQLKRKKLIAFEEYTQGPAKDSKRKQPAIGRILRQDTPIYMDADEELQDISMQIDVSQSKVDTLTSIVDMITKRSYSITNMITWVRYTGGDS